MTPLSKAKEIVSTTTDRARELFDTTKARVDEANLDRRRRSLYCDLGAELYRQRTSGTDAPEELDCIIDEIRELEAEPVEQEEKVEEIAV